MLFCRLNAKEVGYCFVGVGYVSVFTLYIYYGTRNPTQTSEVLAWHMCFVYWRSTAVFLLLNLPLSFCMSEIFKSLFSERFTKLTLDIQL